MDSVVIPQQVAEYVLSEKNRLSKVEAYIYLALKVNGETTSYGKLADAWKWSTSAMVGRFIAELQKVGFVEVEATRTGTKITLKDTPKDTQKPAKTKDKRKVEDTPKDTPKQTDLFGNPVTDPRIVALNKRFSVFNYDCDFSFVEPQLEDAFFEWLDYKKRRREKYKDQKSLQKCYNKMKKDCKDSSLVAKQMVEQSVANNYAGLFPIKDTTGGVLYGKILKGERDEIIDNSKEW